MANNRISRSYNASPLPTSDEFLSFLQPSPRPDTSILNTFSTRAHSPRFTSKESKSKKVSPLPVSHNIKARLELTQKSNAMLVERNKVLAKEKGLLQKKLSKGKNDPREVFKEQLVNFTKESYFNKRNKETNGGIKEIGEKVTEIRKILNWAFEQSDDTMVRFVKPGLAEAISKIKGFEIDVEAYKAYCLSESEGKIRVLELRANSQTAESQAAVNILIGKNSELSKTIHNLELRIEEQHKYLQGLKAEVVLANTLEGKAKVLEKFRKEVEAKVFEDKRKETEEIMESMAAVESEHIAMLKKLSAMQEEMSKKDKVLENYIKEIAEQKIKFSEISSILQYKKRKSKENKEKYSKIIERITLSKTPAKLSDSDYLAYSSCLAAALEDFLL